MIRRIVTFGKIFLSLLGDKRTPTRTKVLPWMALLYLISPLDLVPDLIPLLGQLDDIGIIGLLLWIAINAVSPSLYKEHAKRVEGDIIDIEPS
jgi:uncharacterized membrane protein YkvA (DUF1232 family)